MDLEDKLAIVLEICDKLGLEVRSERLGGSGGGLCRIKGKNVVFIDLEAEADSRYERLICDLSDFAQIEEIYIVPEIRADMERWRK